MDAEGAQQADTADGCADFHPCDGVPSAPLHQPHLAGNHTFTYQNPNKV